MSCSPQKYMSGSRPPKRLSSPALAAICVYPDASKNVQS